MTIDYAFAIRMGLEPTTSCVTGRRSNQLNYRTKDTQYTQIFVRESIFRFVFSITVACNGIYVVQRILPVVQTLFEFSF